MSWLVAGSLAGFPLACLNASIVVICLAYVGWLAPSVLASGLVFLVVTAVLLVPGSLVRQCGRRGAPYDGRESLRSPKWCSQ